jgi:hypothetical protein
MSTKVRKVTFAIALLPLLSGCLKNQLRLQPNPPPEITSKAGVNDLLADGWLSKYHIRLKEGLCPDDKPPQSGQCANGTYTAVVIAERNAYIGAIQAKIDESYDNFKASLYAGHAYLTVGTDLAVLGLSGAGSVIADTAIKSILAATSAGVVGSTASIDKQVLNQQNTLAIIATMDAQRATENAIIVQQEKNASITEYPLETALLDLRAYYVQGTVLAALEGIQGNAQTQKQKADQTVSDTLHLASQESKDKDKPKQVVIPALTTAQ